MIDDTDETIVQAMVSTGWFGNLDDALEELVFGTVKLGFWINQFQVVTAPASSAVSELGVKFKVIALVQKEANPDEIDTDFP